MYEVITDIGYIPLLQHKSCTSSIFLTLWGLISKVRVNSNKDTSILLQS